MPVPSRCASRLVGSALGLSLVAGLAAAVPAAPALAHPGVPATIFDANTVGWATWRDMPLGDLDDRITQYRNDGYLIVDLDLDTEGTAVKASVVAQKNTDNRAWWIFDSLTAAQYTAQQAAATEAGMRQTDVETYLLGGVRRYGAIWVENKENLTGAAKRDLTSAELATFETQQRTAGRLPVAVDSYLDGSTVKYAAVFVQNTAGLTWHLHRGLTSAAYGEVVETLQPTHRILGTDSVKAPAGQLFTGIFWQHTNGRSWRQLRNMTKQSYLNNLWRSKDEGFRVVAFERYDTAGGVRYAAVWRENGTRFGWALRGQVNAAVHKQLDDFDVPGISVTVMQGGVVKYSRGFGHADVDADVWMDSEHVLGLASVSKAVAGVLTLRLAELGRIKVNDRLDKELPAIPAQHAATTLKNLADNRGCVQHYNEGTGRFGDNHPYATSLDSAEDFWDAPRWVRPPTPPGQQPAPACMVGTTYHYSTHGYTLLCAALEQADDRNTVDLIEDRLTTPYGLGTLKAELVGDTSVRRSRVYNSRNEAFALPDRSEKYCGGGMESSAPDLASFGHKLLTDKIFGTTTTRDQLWPRPAADKTSYSYGWSMANPTSAAGVPHLVAAKSGGNEGARSYLRIYPDDDIVIAVLSNRMNREDAQDNPLPTHNMVKLGTDIGTLVINDLEN
jgi:CubicO group peptidase (beta-lactamase class C family)